MCSLLSKRSYSELLQRTSLKYLWMSTVAFLAQSAASVSRKRAEARACLLHDKPHLLKGTKLGTEPHLSLVNSNPVSRGKPLVGLYVAHTVLQVPESLCQIHLQQVPQKVLEVRAEVWREPDLQGHSRRWSPVPAAGPFCSDFMKTEKGSSDL